MDLMRPLARHLFYPLALWRSGDLAQLRYLREYERSQYLSPDVLRALQTTRLQAILDHAYRQCPFYRRRFDRAGLVPSDVRCLEDLRALPPLEKREVQRHRDDLVAQDWPQDDLIVNQTGGSTGTPVSFFLSRDRLNSRAGATWRHNRWAGWDVGHRAALLWGAPRDAPPTGWRGCLRRGLVERQLFLDTGHITEERLADYHRQMLRFRPRVVLAYARSAVLFAKYLRARGLTPPRPHAVVTSAEVLTGDERDLIERVFGCPVFNRYGSRETSVLASECERHDGMHLMAEGLVVEIVRGNRPVAPGETGAILVTDLLNFAMPMIRYRIGDAGSWAPGACGCGRTLPRLRAVEGRVTDFVVGADGRLVSGAFLTVALVAKRVSLGQVQIEQTEAGQLLYRIRRGPGFSQLEDLEYLEEATQQHLGAGMRVDYEFVDSIPSEPSGKFVFSRSTVVPEFLS